MFQLLSVSGVEIFRKEILLHRQRVRSERVRRPKGHRLRVIGWQPPSRRPDAATERRRNWPDGTLRGPTVSPGLSLQPARGLHPNTRRAFSALITLAFPFSSPRLILDRLFGTHT